MKFSRHILWLTLFAVAMAQVEATLVVHLRTIYYPDHPLRIFPLVLMSHRDLGLELVREAATMVMIMTVALLADRGATRIFAAFVFVFGLWDLFYYLWLKLMIGWPASWGEWDVLFLIPWPWLGPWLAPVLIALLFVLWGGWVLLQVREVRFGRGPTLLFILGVLLALAAFLLPALPLVIAGEEAFRHYRPGQFPWPFYLAGYLLMAASLWRVATKK